jgi:hypothetical protein
VKDKIQKFLSKYPKGLKASQLADLIGTDRRSVNSYLYGSEGRKYFEIDSNYIWRVKQVPANKSVPAISIKSETPQIVATVLSKPAVVKPIREYRYLPKSKDLLYRSVFWVYQNKTYYEEKRGGFLWSPKYTINGRRHPGYESMKEVKPGDIIIHGYKANIVAISIAKSVCFSFDRPSSSFSEWAKDGWKIECDYFEFPFELSTDSICRKLYELQPDNGPLIAPKIGKQQYLCNANKEMLDCILNAYVSASYRKEQIDRLLQFLQLERTTVFNSDNGKKDQELFEDVRVKKTDKKHIEEGCKIAATILSTQKDTLLTIDTKKYPKQKHLIGKTVGEIFEIEGIDLKYQIKRIWIETE